MYMYIHIYIHTHTHLHTNRYTHVIICVCHGSHTLAVLLTDVLLDKVDELGFGNLARAIVIHLL